MGRYSREPNCSLIIRNLADGADQQELKRMFEKYGSVKDVYIPLDYYTRRQRGFAYVQYEHPDDARDALKDMDKYDYLGQEMKIDFAKGDRKSRDEMMNKERGGRYRRDDRYRRSRYDDDDDRLYRSRRKSRSRSRSRNRSRSRSRNRSRSQSRNRCRTRSRSRSPRTSRRQKRDRSHSRRGVNRRMSRSRSDSSRRRSIDTKRRESRERRSSSLKKSDSPKRMDDVQKSPVPRVSPERSRSRSEESRSSD